MEKKKKKIYTMMIVWDADGVQCPDLDFTLFSSKKKAVDYVNSLIDGQKFIERDSVTNVSAESKGKLSEIPTVPGFCMRLKRPVYWTCVTSVFMGRENRTYRVVFEEDVH